MCDDNEMSEEEEATAHKFVDMINRENWEGEPALRYKIVEWASFAGIIVGIACAVAAALGGVVWVWQKIL